MQNVSRSSHLQHHATPNATPNAVDALSNNSFQRHAGEIFRDALQSRSNGFQTTESRAQRRLEELEIVLNEKLQPRGELRQLTRPGGNSIGAYKTDFHCIFSHSGSSDCFSLTDEHGRKSTTTLNRANLEEQILRDSHEVANASNPSIPGTAIITVSELGGQSRAARTRSLNTLVCKGPAQERDSPDSFKKRYWKTMEDAQVAGLCSVTFAFGKISNEKATRPTLVDLALATATASRYQQTPGVKPISVLFHFETLADKALIDNLIEKRGELVKEDVFQALLRGYIKDPTAFGDTNDFLDKNRAATFVPVAVGVDPTNCQRLKITKARPLNNAPNGIPFGSGVTAALPGESTSAFKEPSTCGITAAGTVIVEPRGDGRVWAVKPTNKFQGLDFTFPKGQMNGKPDPRETAIKEAREESGLEVKLVSFLIDVQGITGHTTRYYLGERVGGTPANVEWESQAVCLVPALQLGAWFKGNASNRDQLVATQFLKGESTTTKAFSTRT